jgi:predicted DNA-binding transcriptional regulator AlpA
MMDLLDIGDLAQIFRTTDKGIYVRRSRSPKTLPPSFRLGGRVVWNRATVETWIEEQERVQTNTGADR